MRLLSKQGKEITMNSAVSGLWGDTQLSDRRSAFFRLLGLFVVVGAALAAMAFFLVNAAIETQRANIALLQQENTLLDAQIKQIASLESDIKTLHQRQKAVEALQAVRNRPVHMLSALVQATPPTVALTRLVQAGTHLTINGVARSNEEVALFLRNLDAMPTYLAHPDLVETVASIAPASLKNARKTLTFSIGVDLVNTDEAAAVQLAADSTQNLQQTLAKPQ